MPAPCRDCCAAIPEEAPACPDAVVIKPDMAKYVAAARRIRALMRALRAEFGDAAVVPGRGLPPPRSALTAHRRAMAAAAIGQV